MFITYVLVLLLVFYGINAEYAKVCKADGHTDIFGNCIYPKRDRESDYERTRPKPRDNEKAKVKEEKGGRWGVGLPGGLAWFEKEF